MPATPEKPRISLPSWRLPANRLDWFALGCVGAHWLYRQLRDRSQRNRDTTLKFCSDDPPYYWLLRWLERMPRQRDLSVFRVMMPMEPGEAAPISNAVAGESKPSLPVLVPTEGVSFSFRGIKCHVEKTDSSGPSQDQYRRRSEFLILRIESRDAAVAVALLGEISEAGSLRKETPKVYVYQWGWQPIRSCPTGRAAILPPGDYNSVAHDMRDFFKSEAWYRDVGLPYRRRYLLHGIAGSGKTTMVIALAGDFGLNVCLICLATHTDESLLEAIRTMPGHSILLLEDIDCAFETRAVKGDAKRLTFSGLLNVLDGAGTPEGGVAFMTTNHRDKLDEALIRPGRVDKELAFGHAIDAQITELAHRFSRNGTQGVPVTLWAGEGISMAVVQERLIQKYRSRSKR